MPAAAEIPVAALEVVDAVKVWNDGTRALAGVSLTVAAGETLALVGESGSGKTTLLRLFNRLVEPTSGEARVAGQAVSKLEPIALRRRIGYVPQDGGLVPHWRGPGKGARGAPALPWERPPRPPPGPGAREIAWA